MWRPWGWSRCDGTPGWNGTEIRERSCASIWCAYLSWGSNQREGDGDPLWSVKMWTWGKDRLTLDSVVPGVRTQNYHHPAVMSWRFEKAVVSSVSQVETQPQLPLRSVSDCCANLNTFLTVWFLMNGIVFSAAAELLFCTCSVYWASEKHFWVGYQDILRCNPMTVNN